MSDALHDAVNRGSSLVARGAFDEGRRLLLSAAMEVDADARDYDSVLGALRDAYEGSKNARALCTLSFYRARTPEAHELRDPELLGSAPAVDRARLERLAGREDAAARSFEEAGLLAHAAVANERAGELTGARALWSRLAHRLATEHVEGHGAHAAERSAEQAYVLGLVRYNVARNAPVSRTRSVRGGDRREAIVAAVGALEDASARFEALGLRERAFDCYNALAAIGATSSTFEHSLEGRVNAIRILREDHLQTFAMQQFEEAIGVAEAAGELSAAASFSREAMSYALSLVGHEADAQTFARRAIELHAAAARAIVRTSGPPELAENAMLAAIGLAADLGLLSTARALYLEAAKIPGLDEARAERHLRGAARLSNSADANFSERSKLAGRPQAAPVEVWIVDVLEWEQDGRAEEATADVLFDAIASGSPALARDPSLVPLRRRAMVARLLALDFAARGDARDAAAIELAGTLAKRLGDLVDYRVLSPLERLARHPSPEVRARAVDVAGTLPFKRSGQLLRRAAEDPDRSVLASVAKAVAKKKSPVFVDPLRRLSIDAPTLEVRISALRALANIDNAEAAETVLTALAAGPTAERAALVEALKTLRLPGTSALRQGAQARLARGVSQEVARDFEAALGASR